MTISPWSMSCHVMAKNFDIYISKFFGHGVVNVTDAVSMMCGSIVQNFTIDILQFTTVYFDTSFLPYLVYLERERR